MYKLRRNFGKLLLLPVLLSLALVSCDRDHHEDDADHHPPAFYITMSEKLSIPEAIQVPDNAPTGNTRVATYYATGVQKYKAQAVAGGTTFQWVLAGPAADLYDISNRKAGTHTFGPTWQLSPADSIYGQHFAPQRTAPAPDPSSIDWLLLQPKIGTTPTGKFAGVTYIQRIATVGGKAPAAAPTHAMATVDVPYKAIYRFTKKNP
jgi:hypothetical protein